MTWFKVDDSFYDHPKIADLGMAARGLWVTAGSYCGRHLTDGHITKKQVRKLGGTPAQVRDLCAAGVWIVCRSHNDCYVFHDWIDMQPTRESEQKRRAEQAERKQRSRERKAANQSKPENVTRDDNVTEPDASRVTHTSSRARRPDPTRPDLNTQVGLSPSRNVDASDENESEQTALVVVTDDSVSLELDRLRNDHLRNDHRRRIEIPDDWQPDDVTRTRFPRPDLDDLADAFRDHAISTGRLCAGRAGWDHAFKNWIRKSAPPGNLGTGDQRVAGWQAMKDPAPRGLDQ